MNHVLQSIPLSQYYNPNFNEVVNLDNRGRLYLPSELVNFEIPKHSNLVLVQDCFTDNNERFLFGFVIGTEYEIDSKLSKVYVDKNPPFNQIYPFISTHKIEAQSRVSVKIKLEEVLGNTDEIRLIGMREYFIIRKP